MIHDVVRALNDRQWPDYVYQQMGTRIGDVVAPHLNPVFGARVVAEPPELGDSKIGGLPHVDGDFVWPTEDDTDEPLALVCQINLNQVGQPLEGMLYLFSIYDSDRAYGYEIDDTTAKVLHVRKPGPLRQASRPAALPDDAIIEERRLIVAPSLVAQERFDYEVEKAIDDTLIALGGAPCGVIQLLGEPDAFRDETREMIDEIDEARLLLYVNGYAVARHAFGEGDFHLVLGKSELDAGNLDGVEVFFEPGT